MQNEEREFLDSDPVGLLLARIKKAHAEYGNQPEARGLILCKLKVCTSLLTLMFIGTTAEHASIVEIERLANDLDIEDESQQLYTLYDSTILTLSKPKRTQVTLPRAVKEVFYETFDQWRQNPSFVPFADNLYVVRIHECCCYLERVAMTPVERGEVLKLLTRLVSYAPLCKERFIGCQAILRHAELVADQGAPGGLVWS